MRYNCMQMKKKATIAILFAIITVIFTLTATACSDGKLPSDLVIKAEDVTGAPSGEYYLPYEIEKYNEYSREYDLSISVHVYEVPSNASVVVNNNRTIQVEKEHTYAVVVRVDGKVDSKQKTFYVEAEKGNRTVTFMHDKNDVVKSFTLPYGGSLDYSQIPELEDRYPSSDEGHYTVILSKRWVVYEEKDVPRALTAEDLTNVTENIPVYSDYEYETIAKKFTMKFDSDGGSKIADFNGDADSVAPMPTEKPIKTGYTFVGWFDDEKRTVFHDWKSGEKMTKDVTLYAKFVKNTVSPTPDGYFTYTLKEDDYGNEYYEIAARDRDILSGNLVLPNNHDGLPVRDTTEKAFEKTSVTSVVIPDIYMLKNQRAFAECKVLTEVKFEENAVADNLASKFFYQCVDLRSVNLPKNILIIRNEAFRNCLSLTEITLPESLQSISGYAFAGCVSLTEINLPDSVRNVGEYAFYGCSQLSEVLVSDDSALGTLEDTCFSDTAITEITLPYALKGKKLLANTGIKVNYYPEKQKPSDEENSDSAPSENE